MTYKKYTIENRQVLPLGVLSLDAVPLELLLGVEGLGEGLLPSKF